MISYAQNFEDVMLYRVFRDQPAGFYIDVGAADPVQNSVTKWFYDLGWSGINIEPHPAFFKALQHDRPRDTNLNCGAGAMSGEAMFVELPTREWSSFDDVARTDAVARGEVIVERPTSILTLNEIIERHGGGRTIDFLKIDVEGWERQVLQGLDLTRHRPAVMVVEATHQGTAEQTSASWEDIRIKANYCPVYFDGLNKFYVVRENMELARHFVVPPNVFDEFTLQENEARLQDIRTLTAMVKQFRAESETRLQDIHTLTTMVKQSQAESEARLEGIHTLTATVKQSQAESEARLEGIHTLTAMVKQSQAESEARLQEIHTLTAIVKQSQAEGEARLEQIYTLTAMVKQARTEGEARLEQIHTLTAVLNKSQADGAAWLQQRNKLQADLADLTGRHDALLMKIADLAPRAASHDHLIATLEMPDAPRSLKIVLPIARVFRKLGRGIQGRPFALRW